MRLPQPDSVAIMNGEAIRADQLRWGWDDPVFHFGLGLFETLAVRNGSVIDLSAHLDRIESSTKLLGWRDGDPREWGAGIQRVAQGCAPVGWIKFMLSAGSRWCAFGGQLETDAYQLPVRGGIYPHVRGTEPSQQHKMVSYAAHALAFAWAQDNGYDEALWVNGKGHIVEGSRSNVFALRGRSLFTPPLASGALPGVVRRRVIEAAGQCGYSVHEDKLRVPRLLSADAAFITNSLGGIRPLIELDGRATCRNAARLAPLQRRVEALRGI